MREKSERETEVTSAAAANFFSCSAAVFLDQRPARERTTGSVSRLQPASSRGILANQDACPPRLCRRAGLVCVCSRTHLRHHEKRREQLSEPRLHGCHHAVLCVHFLRASCDLLRRVHLSMRLPDQRVLLQSAGYAHLPSHFSLVFSLVRLRFSGKKAQGVQF